jgi:hypothetical protein
MPFERKDDDSAKVLVKLKGNPLNYIMSFKAQYLQKLGKDLGKGDAINYLLNKIPRQAIDDAISQVIKEHEKDKKPQKTEEEKKE